MARRRRHRNPSRARPGCAPGDLGVVIVDEEQRFGVAQKEKLKGLKASIDVLSLSATPIPRTLNSAVGSARRIGDRDAAPRSPGGPDACAAVPPRGGARAILTETARGGRCSSSTTASPRLAQSPRSSARPCPRRGRGRARTDGGTHPRKVDGQLFSRPRRRAALHLDHRERPRYSNANTLIINRADRFGLAQLYSFADGLAAPTAWRSRTCCPPERSLSEEARARLAAILEFADLGAGFRIAARDLEIRGAGNILGAEQHGHLRAVGYETYCTSSRRRCNELQGQEAAAAADQRRASSWSRPPAAGQLHPGGDAAPRRLPADRRSARERGARRPARRVRRFVLGRRHRSSTTCSSTSACAGVRSYWGFAKSDARA